MAGADRAPVLLWAVKGGENNHANPGILKDALIWKKQTKEWHGATVPRMPTMRAVSPGASEAA